MKHLKVFIKSVFVLLCVLILVVISILFGTNYGRELRITAAGSILTSQHPQYAKYAFLSQN